MFPARTLDELGIRVTDAKSVVDQCVNSRSKFLWHPLGFIMCRLAEHQSRKLRLHLWPRDGGRPQDPAWPIHDHVFDLQSWVLAGTISNVEYCASQVGVEYQLYSAAYEDGESVLRRSERRVRLKEAHRSEYVSGQQYVIEAGIFHQSVRKGEATAITLCETYDRMQSGPRVAGGLDGAATYVYSRDEVAATDLSRILQGCDW